MEDQAVVLFQGDSVTDCGRNYEDPRSLGTGYAFAAAAEFGRKYPDKNVTFINKGISGNRVAELEQRWQRDCLDIAPDYVSILIGINNTWRRYDSNDPTSTEQYYECYRRLILNTLKLDIKGLILLEPFVVPVNEEQKGWYEDLNPKILAVRELAREFKTLYVPLDGLFSSASTQTGSAYWAQDGVHPTPAGHGLIADAWLKAVGAK
nr:SGNH/GDSL hydrolase family protein [Paenibacillus caui]